MLDVERLKKIIDMLKMLTESGNITWENKKGVFSSNYLGDLYELCPVIFTVNGGMMAMTILSKELMDFYTYLNNRFVADVLINKLDKACDEKYLG